MCVFAYTVYYIFFSLLFAKLLKLLFFGISIFYNVYVLVLKTFIFLFLTIFCRLLIFTCWIAFITDVTAVYMRVGVVTYVAMFVNYPVNVNK